MYAGFLKGLISELLHLPNQKDEMKYDTIEGNSIRTLKYETPLPSIHTYKLFNPNLPKPSPSLSPPTKPRRKLLGSRDAYGRGGAEWPWGSMPRYSEGRARRGGGEARREKKSKRKKSSFQPNKRLAPFSSPRGLPKHLTRFSTLSSIHLGLGRQHLTHSPFSSLQTLNEKAKQNQQLDSGLLNPPIFFFHS